MGKSESVSHRHLKARRGWVSEREWYQAKGQHSALSAEVGIAKGGQVWDVRVVADVCSMRTTWSRVV